MERIFGILHCSRCHGMTKFVSYDRNDDPDYSECVECGFSFGKLIDTTALDPADRVRSVLSKQTVAEGYRRYAKREIAERKAMGIALKEPDEIRAEMGYRRQ